MGVAVKRPSVGSSRISVRSCPIPVRGAVECAGRRLTARGSASRRCLSAFLLFALAIVIVPSLLSGRAQADAYYPPSCWHTAVSETSWSLLCTCGTNGSAFVRDANYVTGIQREINKLEGYYPGWVSAGTQDGIFGSQTEAGVTAFQAYFMPRRWDGIVGPDTWGWLYDLLVYRGENGLYSMYSAGASTNQFWRYYNSMGYWQIVSKNGGGVWVQFNVSGPS